MTLSPRDLEQQLALLIIYRRHLDVLITQRKMHGVANVPPAIAEGIFAARHNIARVKTILSENGHDVIDGVNDVEPPESSSGQRVLLTIDARVEDLDTLRAFAQDVYIVKSL